MGLTRAEKTMSAETDGQLANKIWQVHAAIDAVYGKGFAKDNPDTVARFMLANEVAALRDVIASGSGAITVGIESSVPS
jgi:hypothetical protein